MTNIIFLESYTRKTDYLKSSCLKLPLESFITYFIYKYCSPDRITLNFSFIANTTERKELILQCENSLNFVDVSETPWQVASCVYPVVLYEDTIITGLCAVARHICKHRTVPPTVEEHEEGLLGFRKSCLQAPNEVSIWTKFCEVEIIKTVTEVLNTDKVNEVPQNLVRFETHLSKPVRVHNVYKIARDIKKENFKSLDENVEKSTKGNDKISPNNIRVPKTRKWKSNTKKDLEVNSSTNIEDLNINHKYAEGPFLTLADIILLPSYHILLRCFGETIFQTSLPLTYKWFRSVTDLHELSNLLGLINGIQTKNLIVEDIVFPIVKDVSLYKSDPKRHNPKKRLFTKEDDIDNALSSLKFGMELNVDSNDFECGIDWTSIPDGANPSAGHLPDERKARKSQQLENLTLAVLNISKDGDLIVDFCSGSGHLGILIAHLLPHCTIILLENKEQSLLRARQRVHDMGLKNVYFFQCNLDFFIGKFDIGIALHACGIASDLVLDKCLKVNAKFVLCPCCYGSLHATDRLEYPRSERFKEVSLEQYLCIGHAADQTHEGHPLMVRGAKCMAVIDSDRSRLAEEFGYKVTLSRLKPLSCTPKNNLLIGVPS